MGIKLITIAAHSRFVRDLLCVLIGVRLGGKGKALDCLVCNATQNLFANFPTEDFIMIHFSYSTKKVTGLFVLALIWSFWVS